MNNQKIKELLNEVVEIELKNGFKILYYENEDFKNYYMEYTTKYGGIDYTYLKEDKEIKHPPGIAHFLEHVMFNMPYGDGLSEFDKYLGSANAYTSYEKTSYLVKCSQNAQENLTTLLDLVSNIYIDYEKVEKEKGIIVEEAGMYDKDPEWLIFKNSLKNGLHNIKYKSDILGSVENIKSMTVEKLEEAYYDFYTPSNQFIVIIGPEVKNLVNYTKQYMENKKSNNLEIKKIRNKENITLGSENNKKESILEKKEVSQNYLSISYKYVFDKQIENFKGSLYLDFALELMYTDFNQSYIEAEENYLIDYTFEYDCLMASNTILVMFFSINHEATQIEDFIKSISLSNIEQEQVQAIVNKNIGRLFRRFNEEVSIGKFINHLHFKGETLNTYYDHLLNFDIKEVMKIIDKSHLNKQINYEIKKS